MGHRLVLATPKGSHELPAHVTLGVSSMGKPLPGSQPGFLQLTLGVGLGRVPPNKPPSGCSFVRKGTCSFVRAATQSSLDWVA